jgi:hypothetical protein
VFEERNMVSALFFDIKIAYDNVHCGNLMERLKAVGFSGKQAAERCGIESGIYRWICAMLESRNIIDTFLGETLGASVAGGIHKELCFCFCCGS